MRRRTCSNPVALVALGLLASGGCRSSDAEPPAADYPLVESSSFGSMRNVSMSWSLSSPIWFGATPGELDLELARRRGVTTVIDLSTLEEECEVDADGACRRLGISYYHPEVPSSSDPSDELVDLVLATLARDDAEPTLMYCGSGRRCAMFLAIFRAIYVRVPLDEALVEARRAGMRPQDEGFVRAQVERLIRARSSVRTAEPGAWGTSALGAGARGDSPSAQASFRPAS